MAYFECLHKVKLIVDLIHERGIATMNYPVSNAADEYGEYVTGPCIMTAETKSEMRRVLSDFQSGHFARGWMLENEVNRSRRCGRTASNRGSGARLRAMMPWIGANKFVDEEKNQGLSETGQGEFGGLW